jgi:hypothetical protein
MSAPVLERLLATELPPVPACFDGPDQWSGYLRRLHESGVPIVRREDVGKSRGQRSTRTIFRDIAYAPCQDCSIAFARQMAAEGRCQLAQQLALPLTPPKKAV